MRILNTTKICYIKLFKIKGNLELMTTQCVSSLGILFFKCMFSLLPDIIQLTFLRHKNSKLRP